ncbi:TetR/AcrR family transcriptional regulator [Nonomuraea dietziae]|uniref:AcrR family transcriptional regulator n=1 Tax=Nonomuraea dietziae TaxID=65515 RepID=A0A7W5VDW2_9ACTN|nr:TetR/AcrR family transcriptional regulator [Nonomuraea dietziae]MBB3730288.1 AcrR family transcriptional regulator [Nonomuraea dietziae]
MARQRSFDRNQALESAVQEFWRHGYEATSVASLTQAMGIRPPSLYAAFGDKRALFQEAVLRYRETHGAFSTRALAEETTGREAIRRLLMETAAEYTDPAHPPGCLIISGAVNCGPESAEVQEWLRGFREAAKAALEARIDGPDAPALATFYASVIQGMSTQARDGATREELERVAELAMLAYPASER